MPLAQAVAKEGTTSSSSLEGEIDRFQFEEVAIVISETEEEVDEYLCVQAPASIITYVGDSLRQKQVQASCESSSSSASCWPRAKTQPWSEEEETHWGSWGRWDGPFQRKQTAQTNIGTKEQEVQLYW